MLAFFKELFKSGTELELARNEINDLKAELKKAHDTRLELESNLQSLKLDLQEQHRLNEDLKTEISLNNQKQETTLKGLLSQQSENLAKEIAAPVVQLVTQQHLSTRRTIQAKDVLAVSMRLVQSLENYGLKLEGQIGESTSFDSGKHEGLSLSEEAPAEGSMVTINMPGVSFQGKILRKIAVSQAAPAQIQEGS